MAVQVEQDYSKSPKPAAEKAGLTLIPEVDALHRKLAMPGMLYYNWASDEISSSDIVRAARVALFCQASGLKPLSVGRDFVLCDEVVAEAAERSARKASSHQKEPEGIYWTKEAHMREQGRREADLRKQAGEVFSKAQALLPVGKKSLEKFISMYKAEVNSGEEVPDESVLLRRAEVMIVKATGSLRVTYEPLVESSRPESMVPESPKTAYSGPQDDTWRDLPSTFQDQFRGLSPPEKNKPAELPKSNVVYIAAKRKLANK